MKNIYRADLKKMTVKNVEIREGVVTNVLFDNAVIKEDILFYNGLMGAYISFEHGTRLPDYVEAQDYLRYSVEQSKNPEEAHFQCCYADYDHMQLDRMVSRKEFREMKKEARKRK